MIFHLLLPPPPPLSSLSPSLSFSPPLSLPPSLYVPLSLSNPMYVPVPEVIFAICTAVLSLWQAGPRCALEYIYMYMYIAPLVLAALGMDGFKGHSQTSRNIIFWSSHIGCGPCVCMYIYTYTSV